MRQEEPMGIDGTDRGGHRRSRRRSRCRQDRPTTPRRLLASLPRYRPDPRRR